MVNVARSRQSCRGLVVAYFMGLTSIGCGGETASGPAPFDGEGASALHDATNGLTDGDNSATQGDEGMDGSSGDDVQEEQALSEGLVDACADNEAGPVYLIDGVCVACIPGTEQCSADRSGIQKCGSDGQWGPPACPTGTTDCVEFNGGMFCQ